MIRIPRRWALAATGGLVLLAIGGIAGARSPGPRGAAPVNQVSTVPTPPRDALTTAIIRAQQRLRTVPGDYTTWAALGSAYVEQARVTADATYYPKAQGALDRSLALRSADNAPALAGYGALANARHDFAGARTWARKALAADPYSADAYGVLTDAQTQLGDAPAATDAVQHMLDLRPGLAAYTRASYDLEQHGRTGDAQALMRQALAAAIDPADVAFCRYQLGELEWQNGHLDAADREYSAGLAVDSTYLPLHEGRAKVEMARGHTDAALTAYADITGRYPSPGYFVEYADALRAAGRKTEAAQQLALADAAQRLFTANGGTDDLTGANLALAEQRPADALALVRSEWQRRQHADVADTLGWALHVNGQDTEAVRYARLATSLGGHNARYAYHLGLIELAWSDTTAARRDLGTAMATNPYFSPVDAPLAAGILAGLEAR